MLWLINWLISFPVVHAILNDTTWSHQLKARLMVSSESHLVSIRCSLYWWTMSKVHASMCLQDTARQQQRMVRLWKDVKEFLHTLNVMLLGRGTTTSC
jgi:hypothetical protein